MLKLFVLLFFVSGVVVGEEITDSLAVYDSSAVEEEEQIPTAPMVDDERAVVERLMQELGLPDNIGVDDITVFESGRLVLLDLSNPQVSRAGFESFPEDITKLTALKVLILKNNSIGTIPDEISNLRDLRELDMASNRLRTIPASVKNLRRLQKLDLRYNSFSQFPEEVLTLESLSYLHLWGNRLTTLPDKINKLSNLRQLFLNQNRLNSLPESIMELELDYCDFQMNRLCDLSSELDEWAESMNRRYREYQRCW
ncbi:leucine-rich repeat domain-containing protein [Chitinispirillales bacterium ANBcel5]|uniref:leucine-rich repeat domain-containing protein n=1 Tax=Cellulosispirillum alkaliphilum TaxID=3039283 RepID=UPI002A4F738C|nr:leucine-rich repeat domain-containing protein [Chitinispirillales bacterium ANBcel5]